MEPTWPRNCSKHKQLGRVPSFAKAKLVPKGIKVGKPISEGAICVLPGNSKMASKLTGMVKDSDTSFPHDSPHVGAGGPSKSLAAIDSEIKVTGKLLHKVKLTNGKIGIHRQCLPIINISQTPNGGSLHPHPTRKKVVNQKHSIDTQAATLSKSSAGQKSIRVGITHFEVATHLSQSAAPCHGDGIRCSNQNRKAQRRKPRNAVEAFHQVSRNASQRSGSGVRILDLMQQESPKV